MLCPRCGTPNRAHALHCVRCGTLLEETKDGFGDRRRPKRPPSVDFLEDETVMNSASTEPTPRTRSDRPAIAEVGFNKRVAPDREETPISSLTQPWDQIVEETERPVKRPRPSSLPPVKKQSHVPSLPRKPTRPVKPDPFSSLDADTDEGVVQVPPDPDQFASLQPMKKRVRNEAPPPPPPKKVVTSDLPPFGVGDTSWPAGATKPVASPLKRTPERKRNDLLENKPVTGAKPPASRPPKEETAFGALVDSGPSSRQGGETIAAPGELAGIVSSLPLPARPELIGDLMSPAAVRQEREQRRAEMRKSVETTSPEELRSLRPSLDLFEDTRDVPPPDRLEETRALTENPLTRPPLSAPISDLMPLPAAAAPKPDVRPFGETQVVLRLASGSRRALAASIDALIVLVVVIVPALLGVFGEDVSTANWIDPDDVSLLLVQGKLTLPLALMAVLAVLLSALTHGLMGRSVGKLICGLELVRKKTGERVSIVRAIVRALLSLFSVILGGAGYLWLIVDRRARTFHDYLSGTVVVLASSRAEGAKVDERFVQEPTL